MRRDDQQMRGQRYKIDVGQNRLVDETERDEVIAGVGTCLNADVTGPEIIRVEVPASDVLLYLHDGRYGRHEAECWCC